MQRSLLYLLLFAISFSIVNAQSNDKKLLEDIDITTDTLKKIKLLEKLWQNNAYNNESDAIKYAEDALSLSQVLKNDKQLARAYERLGISHANVSNYQASNIAYSKASEINERLGKMRRVGGLLINKGLNFKDIGQLDSALFYINQSEKYIDLSCCKDDTLLLTNYLGTKASILLSKGHYNLALKNAIRASKLTQLVKDDIQYADNIQIMADANESLGNIKIAIKYFRESLNIYNKNKDTYYESEVCRKLGVLYSNLKPIEKDSAKFYFKRSLKLAQEIEIVFLEALTKIDYATFLVKSKDFELAKNELDESYEIASSIKDTFGLSDIYLNKGKIYLHDNKIVDAINYLEKARALKTKMGLLSGEAESNKLLAHASFLQGNIKGTYNYMNEHKRLSDSLYNIEKSSKFDELQTIYETEKKEAEIALQNEEIKTLNVQAKNDKLTKTLYASGMFSFITIAGLIYFGFRQRIKKNKTEREKQETILKQEIEFKKKELASQTLHLVQKNTFIQELKENLEKIKKSPELFKIEFRRLVMLLKKESAEDKDWEVFKSYFSEVHNNFDNKLKSISQDITEKEIRLASFLRMNLSTKEIASMLNVLPESVLKSKYRLKKKLNLDKETDLNVFLNTM